MATFWIPLTLILLLFFLPWLDRSIYRTPLRRFWTTGLATVFLVMTAFLTYKGATAPRPPVAVSAARAKVETEALSPLARKGLAVYEQQGCAACHTISGSGGAAGPPLEGIGSKREAIWLKNFITDPKSIKPKSSMPSYDDLAAEEAEALVIYLQALK